MKMTSQRLKTLGIRDCTFKILYGLPASVLHFGETDK